MTIEAPSHPGLSDAETRGPADVSIAWQLDAHLLDLPLMVAPSDAVISPATATLADKLGGLAVLNGEGLWTRYEEPELVAARIEEIRGTGARTAVRFSPQHTLVFANTALDAGADVLVIQGTVISAE